MRPTNTAKLSREVANCDDRFKAMDLAQSILNDEYLNRYYPEAVHTFINYLKGKWNI